MQRGSLLSGAQSELRLYLTAAWWTDQNVRDRQSHRHTNTQRQTNTDTDTETTPPVSVLGVADCLEIQVVDNDTDIERQTQAERHILREGKGGRRRYTPRNAMKTIPLLLSGVQSELRLCLTVALWTDWNVRG